MQKGSSANQSAPSPAVRTLSNNAAGTTTASSATTSAIVKKDERLDFNEKRELDASFVGGIAPTVATVDDDNEEDGSVASLTTPSAASTAADEFQAAFNKHKQQYQQQQHPQSQPQQQQPTYRSTVADYYASSLWQNQSHPAYCSWNRAQQLPLNNSTKVVHQQHTVGNAAASSSSTLPSNYSASAAANHNNNSVVQFRKDASGSRARSNVSQSTADSQSTCSVNVDASTLNQRTHQLSSSLILTPTNPLYLPTPTHKAKDTSSVAQLASHNNSRSQQLADINNSSSYNNAFLLMSASPQGVMPGGSAASQQQLNANSAMITSAVSTTASTVMPQFCCECAATQDRCSGNNCACYAQRRMCDEHCESARYRGDCLNQAICKCSCEADPSKPAKNVCTKSERCDCLRIKEGCSKLCACKQVCKNREPPKAMLKVAKPTQGCQCAKTKKQCVKKECQCRSVYEFCSSSCKCAGDCSNGASKFHVPKHVQSCFLEHKAESSGLIVTLIGNDYIYRGDFYHESKSDLHVEEQLVAAIYDLISKYKVDLYDIVIFVSKSPCFHQDCEPKCEVVDECRSNKACAKLLGLLLSKVRKELSKVDVRMTAKFLYPHLTRGDLYTKQGILSMLQAGIKVEPLLLKDWSAIMDWSPHADHKGEYLQMWGNHNLDRSVAQSQSFINECRRALGLSMKFWVAEIHEIVTNTILHYSEIRLKCNELNDALKQLDLTATPHKIRSTPSKRRSFIDIIELRDKLLMRGTSDSTRGKGAGSNISVASDDAHAQAMVASFCGRSFDDNETNEIAQRIRRATTNINVEIETLLEFLTHKSAVG